MDELSTTARIRHHLSWWSGKVMASNLWGKPLPKRSPDGLTLAEVLEAPQPRRPRRGNVTGLETAFMWIGVVTTVLAVLVIALALAGVLYRQAVPLSEPGREG